MGQLTVICVFCTLILGSCTRNVHKDTRTTYPEVAKMASFEKIDNGDDSLRVVAEIDTWGDGVPVGRIVGVSFIGNELFFADAQQEKIHIIDAKSFEYKRVIESDRRQAIHNLLGAVRNENSLILVDGLGPDLLKSYDFKGNFIKKNKLTTPLDWSFSVGNYTFVMTDSLGYFTKNIANKGYKVARYRILDNNVEKIDEIVPVSDLIGVSDSATTSTAIANMSLLKSNLKENTFFVLPTDKYLLNTYTFTGSLVSSIDLRGIPELSRSYDQLNSTPLTSIFQSAVIDQEDNIYFHIPDVKESMTKDTPWESLGMLVVAINPHKQTYRLYTMAPRSVSPLGWVNNILWCYDFAQRKLIAYQNTTS